MFVSIFGALAVLLAQSSALPPVDGTTGPDPAVEARAEAGDPEALFQIALYRMESLSLAGTPDPAEADAIRDLLNRAADQGHGAALNMLGTIAGSDGSGDMATAIAYYERAHAAGEPGGSVNLGVALLHADSPADQQRGIAILSRFSERDDVDQRLTGIASGYLGYAASVGAGGQAIDYDSGLQLLLLGHEVDPENSDFSYLLGRYYESGAAGPVDLAAAAQSFIAAGEAGHAIGAWKAGMAYLSGSGVEVNELEAFRFMNLSARNGYDRGMISLAVMNATGQGIPVNGERALEWYGNAAALGNAHAMRAQGLMLLLGEAGEAEPATGYALLSMAAGTGDAIAAAVIEEVTPQLPDTPEWVASVEAAQTRFLDTNGLAQADLYGAER